jgi:hypothetical protein
MHVSFITRKGYVDGSHRSPGFASQNVRTLDEHAQHPVAAIGLPRFSFSGCPSDRLRCPRLQLRGSAGFSPASHSAGISPAYDHARTQFEKEQLPQPAKFIGHATQSQTLAVDSTSDPIS